MTNSETPLFGISEFTTMPWSFEQDIKNYAQLGVQAIEICEIKLDKHKALDQVTQALDAGLIVSSVQPAVRTLIPSQSQPEPQDLGARMDCFRQTITRLSSKTPGVPYVSNTGPPLKGNMQQAMDIAVEEYTALSDFAADHGVKIALEPLNPTIINIETAVWSLAQACKIVDAVSKPSFGVCLDFWNIWQNADIEAQIRAAGSRIFVVQLSDWRTPQSFQDRLIPGQGDIPLPSLLRATKDSGYTGPLVVEIFSDHVPDALWKTDLSSVIQDSRSGVEAAWQEALGLV